MVFRSAVLCEDRLYPVSEAKAAGTAKPPNEDRSAIAPDPDPDGPDGGTLRDVPVALSPSPLPKASIDELRLFQRIRNINMKIRIAAPATPPTTPPTTVDVDGDESEESSEPAAAVLVDVSPDPVPVPDPPPTMPSVPVDVAVEDELGE